jgi:hypothetical protein
LRQRERRQRRRYDDGGRRSPQSDRANRQLSCSDRSRQYYRGGRVLRDAVAAFGKFFMTQPYSALNDGNLYGEITGLVSSADNVKIFNLVQLYR